MCVMEEGEACSRWNGLLAKIIHFGGKHGTRNLPFVLPRCPWPDFQLLLHWNLPPRLHEHTKKLEKIEVGYVGREENNESWPQAGPLLLFPRWMD